METIEIVEMSSVKNLIKYCKEEKMEAKKEIHKLWNERHLYRGIRTLIRINIRNIRLWNESIKKYRLWLKDLKEYVKELEMKLNELYSQYAPEIETEPLYQKIQFIKG